MHKSFLIPLTEVFNSLTFKLYATGSRPRKGVDLLTHLSCLYKKPKSLTPLVSLDNSCVLEQDQTLFFRGVCTESDKRSVKVAVWPCKTTLHPLVGMACSRAAKPLIGTSIITLCKL